MTTNCVELQSEKDACCDSSQNENRSAIFVSVTLRTRAMVPHFPYAKRQWSTIGCTEYIYMHVSLTYECLQYTTYIHCVADGNPMGGLLGLEVSTQMSSPKN